MVFVAKFLLLCVLEDEKMSLLEIQWTPPVKTLRQFGVCTGLFCAFLWAFVFFRHAMFWMSLSPSAGRIAGVVLWSAGAGMFLLAITYARILRPVYVALNVAVFPIGLVVSHVLMAGIFFGVFLPVGLVFRLLGRDALARKFDPQAKSYWQDHDLQPPARQYFRQF